MKALTICQPYAHLICLPDDHDRAKRVENRTWGTSYRGPLLIHAGKSRQWLNGDNYGIHLADMVFGAIIGVANLAECFKFDDEPSWQSEGVPPNVLKRFPWLGAHDHVSGPFCFVRKVSLTCRKMLWRISWKEQPHETKQPARAARRGCGPKNCSDGIEAAQR